MANPVRKAPPPPPMRKGSVAVYEALYSYKALKADELSFDEGDLLYIVDQIDSNWWLGRHDKMEGLIPRNYVSNENMPQPIIDAARRGNLALLNECLLNGVSANSLDKTGSSALHAASLSGHIGCVERLLKEPKLEINLQNKLGDTPLHNASRKGHDNIVELLLLQGADRNSCNMTNETPRDLAVGFPRVIGLLDECVISSQDGRRASSHPDKDYQIDEEDSDEDS